MKHYVKPVPKYEEIVVNEQLTAKQAVKFRLSINSVMEKTNLIYLEMSNVREIDSMMIRFIYNLNTTLKKNGGDLMLGWCSPDIEYKFKAEGVHKFFHFL